MWPRPTTSQCTAWWVGVACIWQTVHNSRGCKITHIKVHSSMATPNPYVVVLRAHQSDVVGLALAKQLVSELGDRAVLMYDVTRGSGAGTEIYSVFAPDRIIEITDAECKALSKYHVSVWYSFETSFSLMHDKLQAMFGEALAHVWVIEADVYFDGSPKLIFDAISQHAPSADLIGSDVTPQSYSGPGARWMWWSSLKGRFATIPYTERRTAFLPVMRVSTRYLAAMRDELDQSGGHAEVFMACVASYNNLSIVYLPHEFIGGMQCTKVVSYDSRPQNNDHKIYHKCT